MIYSTNMTIDALIMLSGAFVAAFPFLGFPNSWDAFFFLGIGIFIIALGIIVRRRFGHTQETSKNEEISARALPLNEDQVA